MPSRVLIAGGRVVVSGGGRVQAFNDFIGNDDVLGRAGAKILRKRMLPWLRAHVPRRTGKLAQSLRIRQRGATVSLQGRFYANFNNVAALSVQWMEHNRDLFRREMSAELRRQAGV